MRVKISKNNKKITFWYNKEEEHGCRQVEKKLEDIGFMINDIRELVKGGSKAELICTLHPDEFDTWTSTTEDVLNAYIKIGLAPSVIWVSPEKKWQVSLDSSSVDLDRIAADHKDLWHALIESYENWVKLGRRIHGEDLIRQIGSMCAKQGITIHRSVACK